MLLGIAGKMGAGKSFIASILAQRCWRTLDLDILAHQTLDENSDIIEQEFGPGIVGEDGKIDRRILGNRVFDQPRLLQKLEFITYPMIEEKTLEWMELDLSAPAAIHAINLHKTCLPQRCDAIIWVYASWEQRRKRVMKRDGRPWNDIKARFQSQNTLNPKLFSPYAETYRVRNSGNHAQTRHRLEEVLHHLEG